MTAPANLDFEQEGAALGSALGWYLGSGNNVSASAWLAAAWSTHEPLGVPSVDPAVPFLSPNDLTSGSTHWTLHGAAVDANVAVDPLGTSTADRLRDGAVNQVHWIDETDGPRPFLANTTYTFGCFFKDSGSGAPYFGPRIDFGGGVIKGVAAVGGILATVAQASGSTFSDPPNFVISAETLDVGNGWFAVALSFKCPVAMSGKPGFSFKAGLTPENYVGASTGHYIWGAFIYAGELAAAEAFDRPEYLFALVLGTSSLGAVWGNGTVTPGSVEDFERAWGNVPFLLTIESSFGSATWDAAETNTGAETFSFGDGTPGTGWDATYLFTLGSTTTCQFDAAGTNAGFDSFEASAGWDATFLTVLSGPTTATFDGPIPQNFEDFEEVILDVLYTADATTDTMTATAHGMLNTQVVRVINVGGAFPAPLVRTLDYFIVNKTANTFQLSLTSGGAAINITDNGTGDQYTRASAARYWWGPDINPTI